MPPRGTPDFRQLQSLAKEFVLRRTKNLVMKDMPPRLDRDEILELSSAQRVAYDMAEKDGVIHLNEMGESISVQHVFELVLRLKQITNFDPLTGEARSSTGSKPTWKKSPPAAARRSCSASGPRRSTGSTQATGTTAR